MAAKEMYDYLSGVMADNNVMLSVQPSKVFTEIGSFRDVIRMGDDGSEERIQLSSTPIFYVTLQWENPNTSDAGTIFDFYFNSGKGNGRTNSFKWSHPTDGYVYVVRFESELNRTIMNPEIHSIQSCKLRILGRSCEILSIKDSVHSNISNNTILKNIASLVLKDIAHDHISSNLTITST